MGRLSGILAVTLAGVALTTVAPTASAAPAVAPGRCTTPVAITEQYVPDVVVFAATSCGANAQGRLTLTLLEYRNGTSVPARRNASCTTRTGGSCSVRVSMPRLPGATYRSVPKLLITVLPPL